MMNCRSKNFTFDSWDRLKIIMDLRPFLLSARLSSPFPLYGAEILMTGSGERFCSFLNFVMSKLQDFFPAYPRVFNIKFTESETDFFSLTFFLKE
jgi:hypothetical protein